MGECSTFIKTYTFCLALSLSSHYSALSPKVCFAHMHVATAHNVTLLKDFNWQVRLFKNIRIICVKIAMVASQRNKYLQ